MSDNYDHLFRYIIIGDIGKNKKNNKKKKKIIK